MKPRTDHPIRNRVRRWYHRFWFAASQKTLLHDIPVAIFFPDVDDRAVVIPKIRGALDLLQSCDSRRLSRIRNTVRAIMLVEHPGIAAQWIHAASMCELARHYVLSSSTTSADVAATLVHEATHARLLRCGLGYDEAVRARIENACTREELAFVSRLPDNQAIVRRLRDHLARPAEYWSDANVRERELATLQKLGLPHWVVAAVAWLSRKRAA